MYLPYKYLSFACFWHADSSCLGKRKSRANELFAFTTQTLYNIFDKYGLQLAYLSTRLLTAS